MKGNLCNSIKIAGETVNGGYAELISIKEEFVTHMPYSIEFEHAVPLFCLGVTAYKAVRAAEPTLDKSMEYLVVVESDTLQYSLQSYRVLELLQCLEAQTI
jgi:D-arabinose 1-dehydrogenase-like Zn-dependent alcohol dehydrogenase